MADSEDCPIISLRDISLAQGGRVFLRHLSWDLHQGDHWVVRGPNGSGKTTLLKVISGDLWPATRHENRRLYGFTGQLDELDSDPRATDGRFSLVGPDLQNLPVREGWEMIGLEVIAAGLEDTTYLHRDLKKKETKRLGNIVKALGIRKLVDRPFLELSQGEKRKVLLGRALMKNPKIILLDEFTDGLDPGAVVETEGLLAAAAQKLSATIVLTTHREDMSLTQWWRTLELRDGTGTELEPGQFRSRKKKVEIFTGFRERVNPPPPEESVPLARIQGNVAIGEKTILRGIDWTVYPDQHWTIGGPNGSGKTTLLRTLYGDFQVGHGDTLEWFGKENMSLQAARKKMGIFHPEMHAIFPEELRGVRIILSGHFDSIGLIDRPTDRQKLLTLRIARRLGIENLLKKRFGELSYGQERRLLLARALVKAPKVLIFDEPTDCLDDEGRELFWNEVEWQCDRGATAVVASHRRDVPDWIEWGMDLEKGKISRWLRRK